MSTPPRRTSRGRQKIAIARIAKEDARQVCFSKRRGGLFKKASELSVLCGGEVAIVVFSPAGRAFSFGHPSVDSVIGRFLADDDGNRRDALSLISGDGGLNREYAELQAVTEAATKRSGGLKEELSAKQTVLRADVEKMGLAELVEFERALVELRRGLAQSPQMTSQYALIAAPPPTAPPFGNAGGAAGGSFGVKNEEEGVGLPPLPPSLDGFEYGHHLDFFGSV